MKAAIIRDSIVINIAKIDDVSFAESQGWIVSDTARIGDLYENGEFITPEPEPTPVPSSISRRQAKQQLAIDGFLSSVQPAIDAIEDPAQQQFIQIYWDDATTFERDNKELVSLAEALGLSSEQLDEMFIKASRL